MELTPTLLQEIEFRPEFRGYNRAEVDDFLDRVAASVEALLARLREAERHAVGGDDDSIRRTLVLAQRTADAAIKEAEEQASRTVADAEGRAKSIVQDAEAQVQRTLDEAKGKIDEEVTALEQRRDGLLADLGRLEEHLSMRRAAIDRAADDLRHLLEGGDLDAAGPPEMEVPAANGDTAHEEHEEHEETAGAPSTGNGGTVARPLRARPLVSPAVHESAVAAAQALAGADDYEDDEGGPPTMDVDLVRLDDELARRSEEHDPFLAELRKAVTDDEPLGPREDGVEPAPVPLYDQDYLAGREGFRSRLRRRG